MEIGDKVRIINNKRRGFSRKTGRVIYISKRYRFAVVDFGLYRETFFIDDCPANNYRIEVVVADEETDKRAKGINQRNNHRLPAVQRKVGGVPSRG
jgi:hypothetical protein